MYRSEDCHVKSGAMSTDAALCTATNGRVALGACVSSEAVRGSGDPTKAVARETLYPTVSDDEKSETHGWGARPRSAHWVQPERGGVSAVAGTQQVLRRLDPPSARALRPYQRLSCIPRTPEGRPPVQLHVPGPPGGRTSEDAIHKERVCTWQMTCSKTGAAGLHRSPIACMPGVVTDTSQSNISRQYIHNIPEYGSQRHIRI